MEIGVMKGAILVQKGRRFQDHLSNPKNLLIKLFARCKVLLYLNYTVISCKK